MCRKGVTLGKEVRDILCRSGLKMEKYCNEFIFDTIWGTG